MLLKNTTTSTVSFTNYMIAPVIITCLYYKVIFFRSLLSQVVNYILLGSLSDLAGGGRCSLHTYHLTNIPTLVVNSQFSALHILLICSRKAIQKTK
jgi:hypothetical protein